MKTRLLLLLLALLSLTVSTQAATLDNMSRKTELQQGTRVVINGTGVRLRLGPGKQYDYYSHALAKGSSWQYLGTYGGWYAINYNGGVYYVSAQYSYLSTPKQYTQVVINGTGVRLRLGPGKQYDYYSSALAKGSRWQYCGTYGNWYAINYYGTIYYVASAYSYLR